MAGTPPRSSSPPRVGHDLTEALLVRTMQRALESEDPTMTMIAHAEPASAGLAPLLLNV